MSRFIDEASHGRWGEESSNSNSAGLFKGGQAHPNPSEALSHKSDPSYGPLVRALRAQAGILLLINQRIFHEESESLQSQLWW